MNNMNKKTAFGITGVAATLLVAGFAAPAMADDTTSLSEYTSSTSTTATSLSDLFRSGDVSSPIVLAPTVSDIGNGALLSGNDVSAPVTAPVEAPISAPIASGNETAVSDIANPSGSVETGDVNGGDVNGGDIGTSVDDLVDGGSIGTNVDTLVGDILADLGIED